jgi:hypothetical protein
MAIRSRAKSIEFNGITLDEWVENFIIVVLSYDVYMRYSDEECAWLVLNYWENSKPRRWGWSWGAWVSWLFDGNEFYDSLSYEERRELDRLLYEYIEELAEKVDEEDERKMAKLERELRKLLRYLD